MKRLLVGVLCLLLVLVASPVVAANGKMYVGGDYTFAMADFGPVDFDLGALGVNVGSYLNDYFSIEGRLGFGVTDDDISDFTGSLELEIDSYAGAYIRGEIPVNNFSPYLILGFTYVDIGFDANIPSFPSLSGSGSEDDSDFSYGVGASFKTGERFRVNAEYMYWMEFEDEVDVDGFTFGVKYFF